jgi:hypothetical protein
MSALINQARSRVPRFAETAVERARLTVVPRVRSRAPKVPFVSLVTLLLVGGVAGLLAFNTSMQQASFTATSMEQRAAVLDAREQSLQMELETLRDPQRVAVTARRMGMVPPSAPAFLRLEDGAVLGSPAPAAAEDAVRVIPLPTRKPADLRPAPVIVELPENDKKKADEKAERTEKQNSREQRGAANREQGERAGRTSGNGQDRQQGSPR